MQIGVAIAQLAGIVIDACNWELQSIDFDDLQKVIASGNGQSCGIMGPVRAVK